MSVRAVILGLLLGLFISVATYFNDFVMKQTLLIGSFLPVSVFGLAALLVIAVNPLLRLAGPRWPLRMAEVAVVVAIALAACAFPGANFSRYFTTMTAMPPHHAQRRADWASQHVMSYLPGGSHLLAQGQVRDWPALARAVTADGPLRALYEQARPDERQRWDELVRGEPVGPAAIDTLTRSINAILVRDDWLGEGFDGDAHRREIAGRARLVELAPSLVLPPPRGDHALVTGDRLAPEVTTALVTGAGTDNLIALDAVPWSRWMPTILLWGGAAVLLGLASVCLVVVVHPQWSQRELLPYPIARFLLDLSRQSTPGLPDVARSGLFWIGLSIPVVLHLVNGLHVWFPEVPQILTKINLDPLRTLFPNAARVSGSSSVFHPTIYLTAVAFAFFLDRQVSFTVGVSNYLFIAVGALFVANGLPMEYDKFAPNKMNLLRAGAFVGVTLMLLYTGRRYYAAVARGTLGLATRRDVPVAAIWAARLGAAFVAASIGVLMTSGLSLVTTLLLVLTCVVIWIVMTRVVCETGMFLMAGPFLPLGVWPALISPEALGPTQIILLGIGGFLLVGDPKESLMPFAATGLSATTRSGGLMTRIAPLMAIMAVLSMAVAVPVTLGLQYQHGVNKSDGYAYQWMPSKPFDDATRFAGDALMSGDLAGSVEPGNWAQLSHFAADPKAVAWTAAGLLGAVALAVARLRVPAWPLHPVLLIIWGTWGVFNLGFSFLLGWLLKTSVVKTAGIRGYATLVPMMVGVIAGELLAALGWMVSGAVYYFSTGLTPKTYIIFP